MAPLLPCPSAPPGTGPPGIGRPWTGFLGAGLLGTGLLETGTLETGPETGALLDPALLVGLVVLALVVAVGIGVHLLHARLGRGAEDLAPLARLETIETLVGRLASQGSELDLRRLEHVLIDIRDGQRRLEKRLLALVESLGGGGRDVLQPQAPLAELPRGAHLVERVTSRLLAMGFERIEVVTPFEDLQGLAEAEGTVELLVEARRGGALHKGRVLLLDGAITDVKMRDSYGAFP